MASPPVEFKQFFCRFLQNRGICLFNERCLFSHSATNSYKIPENVCLYFLKGNCRKPEEECSFLHIKPDELIEQLTAISRYTGDSSVRPSNPPCTSKEARAFRERLGYKKQVDNSGTSKKNYYRQKDYDVKPKQREERVCGICLEDVVGSNKSFGLLVNCNHTFCYECIGQWRKQNNVSESATRSCPECRKPSEFVVPSRRFAINEDKARVIEQYKNRLKDKICKFEKDGRNFCKFRDSCLFKHTLPFRAAPAPTSNLVLNAFFAEDDEFEVQIITF